MAQLITNGIKISVKTRYNGAIQQGSNEFNAFSYYISIENATTNAVQLLERFWVILDSLNNTEYVEGIGVIGKTPILKPNETYSYKSNCFLHSPIGAMKGNYNMINFENSEEFLVTIPTFKLTSTPTLN